MRSPLLYTLIFILIYSCSKPESFSDLPVQQNSLIPGLNVESSYLKDQLISFNMIDSEGNNITSSTSFIVDNQLINGNTISYDEIGSHNVSANYTIDSQNYSTDLKVFNIVEPINKVIVEDYTGTWCGYCPPVAHAIYELKEVYDNIISVGIHNNDELTIDQESDLRSELGISGFPSARLNRTISWFDPYQISEVNSLLSEENKILKVGLLAPLSGPYSELGNSLVHSLQLALEEIGNKEIFIIPRDSGFNNKKKIDLAIQDIKLQGVKVIIGPITHEEFNHVKEYNDLIFISPSTTTGLSTILCIPRTPD